ncbi:hypothetical protein Pfo_014188 [Paulownia fortunei]|nr:hypothetical protein Pfo_014188 [Paulownia fortunei]
MGIVEIKMVAPMDSVKNRGRSKFFACFNSPAVEDEPCFHSASPPSSYDESGRRRKTGHHSFSGSLKAVFFKTPLVKKLRSKRSRRDSACRSSSNVLCKSTKLINPIKKKSSCKGISGQEESFPDNSDRSSLFSSTSSSCASSISSNSRSGSERIKGSAACLDVKQTNTNNRQHAMKRVGSKYSYSPATGMIVLLVCLVALVFWGKVFAIVTCTSGWLFLAPSRGFQGAGSRVNNVVDSAEYKKRVIMEGLLERNRPRVL